MSSHLNLCRHTLPPSASCGLTDESSFAPGFPAARQVAARKDTELTMENICHIAVKTGKPGCIS